MGSLRAGKGGRVVLPEQIREEFGIDEGDEVVVDIKAVLKTAERRVDVEGLRESLRAHVERLSGIPTRREPRPGELTRTSLEDEFET